MLDANLKTQLKAYLEKVTQPFEIVASLDDGAKSQELLALLNDINSLSEKITLNTAGRDARVPSFALVRHDRDVNVRFAGLPMGHEFTSLVLALLQVGRPPVQAVGRADRADPEPGRRIPLRDLLLAVLPELPGRGPGART